MADVPLLKLNGDPSVEMPAVGFGSGTRSDHETIKHAVISAIKIGYRHFDTAAFYKTEPAIGAGLAEAFKTGLIKREQVFVTSKLHSDSHDSVVQALKESLNALQLEYLDLYLIHAPIRMRKNHKFPPTEEDFLPLDLKGTWQGMEECQKLGLTKAIGVSNFSAKKLQHIMESAKIPPAVNQVELHPVWQQKKLREYCRSVGIQIVAWSPLGGLGKPWGSKSVLENPIIQKLALKYHKTPAQVIIQWITGLGLGAIVKSYNENRLKENINSFDFNLSEEDFKEIETIKQERLAKWEFVCNYTTSPYKTVEDLWDDDL